MTLYRFNTLDKLEQLEAVWEHGALVAEREDDVNRYKFYQLGAFYVEMEWHKEYNVRRALRSFASTNAAMLQPYLDLIDVQF